MLRYSNRSIFGLMETAPGFSMFSPFNATDVDNYNKVLGKLLYNLRTVAATGDSMRKYGTANVTGPNFQDIYSLMQCTPDLRYLDCNECLESAIASLPSCCENKIGGRVIRPSCNIRYENYRFYDQLINVEPKVPPPSTSPSTNHTSSKGKGHTSRRAMMIAIPVVIVILVLCFIWIYLRLLAKKHTKTIKIPSEDDDDEITTLESLQLSFETVRVATNDFADSNKLGESGFGAVYKAWRNHEMHSYWFTLCPRQCS
ncbi:cysteine-rich receptor-like protein kinase 25 isoform X3 [Cicer arietinum]|uniref:cysteine-rich receptor-like protein kinase 25 isoform X3 n=1 Tax=Cicer arietinum TaxID=3827 RepID=UPI003CC623AB